jgi:serine protease Do
VTWFLLILVLYAFINCQSDAQSRVAQVTPSKDRPITSLRDLNQALIDIVAQVKPTVVTVSTEKIFTARTFSPFSSPFSGDPFFDFFFGPRYHQPREREYRQRGLGSGVIVSSDGNILTNNHVVKDADSIYVRTYDGRRFTAKVVGVDPKTDIAVLKIDADDLDYIEIGNSDELQVGEMVLAIGSPMSENLAYTVTQGIVSAKGRSNVGLADYEDFIQTDAAINPGNSGGPLINLDGQLVGINTAIVSRSGGFQGIGFAVPVNMAIRVMNSLLKEGKVVRGWLGVTIQDVNDRIANAFGLSETQGALVGDVMPDSPAEEAGIEPGDIIIAMNNRTIKNSAQLRSAVASTAPGTEVEFTILRGDDTLHITVELGELPSEFAEAPTGGDIEQRLGFTVQTLDKDLAEQYDIDIRLRGVVVTSIDQYSEAYQAGLREGDLIRSVNRQRVKSVADFNRAVRKLKKGDTVLLRVHRQGQSFFIAFEL